MPFAAIRFQIFICQYCTFTGGASYRKLHGENRNTHNYKEDKVEYDKYSSSVLPSQIREFPYVSYSYGAAGTYQKKAQS